jgi:predicted TIM-barrel fold metal-dependent hydrolase
LAGDEPDEVAETRTGAEVALDGARQLTDLLMSGVLGRYADLEVVLSESGIGWIPFVLDACDEGFRRRKIRREEFAGLLPSELFARQVHVNVTFERVEPWHVERLGSTRIMFATGFPGPGAPDGPGGLDGQRHRVLGGLDDASARAIGWDNAARLFAAALTAQWSQG